jgi:hypothetical protein
LRGLGELIFDMKIQQASDFLETIYSLFFNFIFKIKENNKKSVCFE